MTSLVESTISCSGGLVLSRLLAAAPTIAVSGMTDHGCAGAPTFISLVCPVPRKGCTPFADQVSLPRPGEVDQPKARERFAAVSSGLGHACALGQNGEAVCWGSDHERPSFPPKPPADDRHQQRRTPHRVQSAIDNSPVCWSMWDWRSAPEGGSVQCPVDDRASGRGLSMAAGRRRLNTAGRCLCRFQACRRRVYGSRSSAAVGFIPADCGSMVRQCAGDLFKSGEPYENQKYEATSDGDSHTCKSREDGSGNLSVCRGFESLLHEQFAAISSGQSHTCALRLDGSPVCWGSTWDGRASPPEGEQFVAISSGRYHTCALRVDGTPVCWGSE